VNVVVEAGLLLIATALCATTGLTSRVVRSCVQVSIIAVTVVSAIALGVAAIDVAFVGTLLLLVTAVATNYSTEFRRSGQAEQEARQAAERRTALLEAVRALPELHLREAAQIATAALRTLGAAGAGVAVVRDDRVVPIELDGIPPVENLLRVGQGVTGRAIAEKRTAVVEDYRQLADRLPDREHIRSAIAAPIHVGDDVVGAVMAVRDRPGVPTDGQIEVAEVLAAHLGAVVATRRQLDNQRTLLRQMDRLDAMRNAFVKEVSDELRDPLTIIRGAGHTIRRHGEELHDDDRRYLLGRLCDKAEELRNVVTALLDFSRFQASHREPERRSVSLRELLATFGERDLLDVSVPLDTQVSVDVALMRHAVALLLDQHSADVEMSLTDESVMVAFHLEDGDRHTLIRSLVAQLAVEAGGTLRFVDVPTLVLPRTHPAGEVVR